MTFLRQPQKAVLGSSEYSLLSPDLERGFQINYTQKMFNIMTLAIMFLLLSGQCQSWFLYKVPSCHRRRESLIGTDIFIDFENPEMNWKQVESLIK